MARRTTSTRTTRSTTSRRAMAAVRLASREGPPASTWAGQRWWRYVESRAEPHDVAEGLSRARQSVIRWMEITPGAVTAHAQGRGEPRREVRLRFSALTHGQWEAAIGAMTEQALVVAKALSGDLPTNIEDCFAPLGLRLFPATDDDVRAQSDGRTGPAPRSMGAPPRPGPGSAGAPAPAGAGALVAPAPAPPPEPPRAPNPGAWNADVCCLAAILAERLDRDPMLIFTLRGLGQDELSERLRQRRAVAGASAGGAPAYAPRPIAAAEAPAPPLEACMAEFWSPGAGLDELETPLRAPLVKHALLRRLGPSPFKGGKFPLVGLLATCYDTISEAARSGADTDAATDAEAESGSADEASGH